MGWRSFPACFSIPFFRHRSVRIIVTQPIPFVADRFATSAKFYLDGRPAYSAASVARLAQVVGLDSASHRLLDLGCGPGQLAVAFAPFVREVVGIDPEPAMLQAASDYAAGAGVDLVLHQGSSDSLGPDYGRFRLVTIGRAFHWMDRPRTLEILEDLIEPEGGVVLFGHGHPEVPDNHWIAGFEALLRPYNADYAPRAARQSADWLSHEAVLLDSAFSRLERFAVIERRSTPIDHIVNRAFSLSATSPARLGDQTEVLAAKIREFLRPLSQDGTVTEVVETHALLASRPL